MKYKDSENFFNIKNDWSSQIEISPSSINCCDQSSGSTDSFKHQLNCRCLNWLQNENNMLYSLLSYFISKSPDAYNLVSSSIKLPKGLKLSRTDIGIEINRSEEHNQSDSTSQLPQPIWKVDISEYLK